MEEQLLEQALKNLAERQGCPVDEDFFKSNPDCEKCGEDPELTRCWRNFLIWELKNS